MKFRALIRILLFSVGVHLVYTVLHFFLLNRGWLFLAGDLIGFCGIVAAFVLSSRKRTFEAGIALVVAFSVNIFFVNALGDLLKTGGPISYSRIFISASELIFLGIVSVLFITRKQVLIAFGLLASFVLLLHFAGIQANPNSFAVDVFTPFFYLLGALGMIVAMSAIGYSIIDYMDTVEQAHIKSEQTIRLQKEQLEFTVMKRTKALEESNTSLKEFAHAVSHDLKEPLRTISGFLSLASQQLQAENFKKDEIVTMLSFAAKRANDLDSLINDVLEYSRLSHADVKMSSLNLNDVFTNIKERVSVSLAETQTSLSVESLPEIVGEKALITQLFQNILCNAVKYRSPERNPVIHITAEKNNGFHEIRITDNGIGIPAKSLDAVFLPFKRLHGKSSKFDGNGIGLAMSKKIVALHNGKIWAESKEGVGTTIVVQLPISF